MRLSSTATIAGLVLGSFTATAAPARVRELGPGVYLWQGDMDQREIANCTFAVFKDYVLVVDANFPWAAKKIIPAIQQVSKKPIRFVLNTHYHGDHTHGNSIFLDAGAFTVCSAACASELSTKGAKSWESWKDPDHSLAGSRLEPISISFEDKIVFDDGTQRVEMTRMSPSHTKGDSIIYFPRQKIVVTGDLCVTWSRGNNFGDADADYDNWIRTLDKVASWDVSTVVPGHGDPGSLSALTAQRDYMADLLAQVRAGKQAGKSADELVHSINVSRHGNLASSAAGNETSIRAMYKHL